RARRVLPGGSAVHPVLQQRRVQHSLQLLESQLGLRWHTRLSRGRSERGEVRMGLRSDRHARVHLQLKSADFNRLQLTGWRARRQRSDSPDASMTCSSSNSIGWRCTARSFREEGSRPYVSSTTYSAPNSERATRS